MDKDFIFDFVLIAVMFWFYHNFIVKKMMTNPVQVNSQASNASFESQVDSLIGSMGY